MLDGTAAAALPTYRRRSIEFEEAFGAPAATAIRAMDAAGDDLVAARPDWPIAIAEVGCTRDRLIVPLLDPFEARHVAVAICSASIATAVPADRRGLHMSRIGDVVGTAVQRTYPDIAAFAEALADAIDRCQYGGPTTVRVEASVPYIEAVPAETRSAKESVEHLSMLAAVTTGPRRTVDAGLRVTHMVACPCVQRTAAHARSALGLPDTPGMAPGFTHAQRCTTSVTISAAAAPVPVARVLAELDRVLFRTTNTLPRGSELLLVFRAHQTPQFVEDAAREALAATYRALDRSAPFAVLTATSRSVESIHDFDLFATARITRDEALHLWGDAPDGAADR